MNLLSCLLNQDTTMEPFISVVTVYKRFYYRALNGRGNINFLNLHWPQNGYLLTNTKKKENRTKGKEIGSREIVKERHKRLKLSRGYSRSINHASDLFCPGSAANGKLLKYWRRGGTKRRLWSDQNYSVTHLVRMLPNKERRFSVILLSPHLLLLPGFCIKSKQAHSRKECLVLVRISAAIPPEQCFFCVPTSLQRKTRPTYLLLNSSKCFGQECFCPPNFKFLLSEIMVDKVKKWDRRMQRQVSLYLYF